MVKLLFQMRIFLVHIIYIIYSGFLWRKLYDVSMATHYQEIGIIISLVIWSCFYLTLNIFLIILVFRKRLPPILQISWCNVSMVLFIAFSLPTYGFTLHQMYLMEEKQHQLHLNQTQDFQTKDAGIPMSDFIFLQMVMPLLMFSFIIYPLPQKAYVLSEYLGIALEFMNAFDIMDMLSDLSFTLQYGTIWVVVYYLSMSISAILIAFPVKIENEDFVWQKRLVICSQSELNVDGSMTSIIDAPVVLETNFRNQKVQHITARDTCLIVKESFYKNKQTGERKISVLKECKETCETEQQVACVTEKQENKELRQGTSKSTVTWSEGTDWETWRKFFKVILTLIFMDILFATIRFKIMITEYSAEHGFNMFIKNVILAGLHMSYLLQHTKILIVNKLTRTANT